MDNEQLSVKPHPASHVCNGQLQEHRMMKLLVNEKNCLYFCHMISSEHAVNTWMLEDYEMWAWNKMYKIDIFHYCSWGLDRYREPTVDQLCWWIELIYIHDGLLVFFSRTCLFFYDLDNKTVVKAVQLPEPENRMLCCSGSGFSYIKTMLAIA
ncbi:hypothetical protein FXO38_21400, partial [Capsicum annuum]